jgi:hypothetical protein
MNHTAPNRRRSVALAFATTAAVLALALLPAYCRRRVEPEARYPTAAAALRSPDAAEWVPGFMPATARDIYERHGPYRRFVRFTVDSAAAAGLEGALVRLDTAEARRVPVPVAGWSSWWQIAPQTLQTGQGRQVRVYRVDVPAKDRGYLVLDPRTLTAFYWSAAER